MFPRIGINLLVTLPLILCLASCENDTASPLTEDALPMSSTGICADAATYWAIGVADIYRDDFECDGVDWWNPANSLGEDDQIGDTGFVSLGPVAGNYIVLEMEKRIMDGSGSDLVVYEVGGPCNPQTQDCDTYNVYLSDNAFSGFQLVATDVLGDLGDHQPQCIDLSGTGTTGGLFVKIENAKGWDVKTDSCATLGVDVDAVGALNTCPSIEQACAAGGEWVDQVCPPDGDYRNHGEYVRCVAHTANDFVGDLADCFSAAELDAIHGCIVSARASRSREAGTPKNGKEAPIN